jgi:soluble lytic murein transglycosylase-like protein
VTERPTDRVGLRRAASLGRNVLVALAAGVAQGASAYCWEEAARVSGVDERLLSAIAWVESSHNHLARNSSHAHLTGSVGIGLMQIDSRWLPALAREGITEHALQHDACTNLKVGARILADVQRRYGNTWEAIGAYNASCTTLKGADCQRHRAQYAWRVYRHLAQRAAPSNFAAATSAGELVRVSVSGRRAAP